MISHRFEETPPPTKKRANRLREHPAEPFSKSGPLALMLDAYVMQEKRCFVST